MPNKEQKISMEYLQVSSFLYCSAAVANSRRNQRRNRVNAHSPNALNNYNLDLSYKLYLKKFMTIIAHFEFIDMYFIC